MSILNFYQEKRLIKKSFKQKKVFKKHAKTFLSFHETSLRDFLVEGTTYSDNKVKKMETHHYQGKKL
jgi:hypothetical protein